MILVNFVMKSEDEIGLALDKETVSLEECELTNPFRVLFGGRGKTQRLLKR